MSKISFKSFLIILRGQMYPNKSQNPVCVSVAVVLVVGGKKF